MKKITKNNKTIVVALGTLLLGILLFTQIYGVPVQGKITDVKNCGIWIGGGKCHWVINNTISIFRQTGSGVDSRNPSEVKGLSSSRHDIGKEIKALGRPNGLTSIQLSSPYHYINVK